jgi:hypothetical protein
MLVFHISWGDYPYLYTTKMTEIEITYMLMLLYINLVQLRVDMRNRWGLPLALGKIASI